MDDELSRNSDPKSVVLDGERIGSIRIIAEYYRDESAACSEAVPN